MAFFPASNPALLEKKAMSTSAYFRREERIFFAQCNRRMMRGRMEIDLTCGSDAKNGHGVSKGREPAGKQSGGPHAYQPQPTSSPQPLQYPSSHPSNFQLHGAPIPYPSSSSSMSHGDRHNISPPLLPLSHQPHSLLYNPPYLNMNLESYPGELNLDNLDEAWRYRKPPTERRRAGKHTKRVIVGASLM